MKLSILIVLEFVFEIEKRVQKCGSCYSLIWFVFLDKTNLTLGIVVTHKDYTEWFFFIWFFWNNIHRMILLVFCWVLVSFFCYLLLICMNETLVQVVDNYSKFRKYYCTLLSWQWINAYIVNCSVFVCSSIFASLYIWRISSPRHY